MSERPKEHASKACEGESPPWVQIPPTPLRGVIGIWEEGAARRFPPTPPLPLQTLNGAHYFC